MCILLLVNMTMLGRKRSNLMHTVRCEKWVEYGAEKGEISGDIGQIGKHTLQAHREEPFFLCGDRKKVRLAKL